MCVRAHVRSVRDHVAGQNSNFSHDTLTSWHPFAELACIKIKWLHIEPADKNSGACVFIAEQFKSLHLIFFSFFYTCICVCVCLPM